MTSEHGRLCVVGLGNMGLLLAKQIAKTTPVLGFDANNSARDAANKEGIQTVETLDELVSCEVIVLCLPRPEISLSVANELLPQLKTSSTIIETSTVNPDDMRRLSSLCKQFGHDSIDVAIHAGVGDMAKGEARLLIGGPLSTYDRVQRVIDCISMKQTVYGEVGSGMAAKVVNNAVAHAVTVVLAEAMEMAATEGISIPQFVDLLNGPEGGLLRPLTHRIGERMANQDFEGGMSTNAALKDSRLALEYASSKNTPLFAIQASHTVYEIAVSAGLGGSDYAAISKLWSDLFKRRMEG